MAYLTPIILKWLEKDGISPCKNLYSVTNLRNNIIERSTQKGWQRKNHCLRKTKVDNLDNILSQIST